MNSFFQYTIELRDKLTAPLKKAGNVVAENTRRVKGLRSEVGNLDKARLNGIAGSFGNLFKAVAPIAIVVGGMMKLQSAIMGSQQAYKAQGVSETQLTAVMRNTMSATKAEVDSILALAAAQQKLGVIGSEVQLSGAQELSTYLTKSDTLKKLIPVMNDMLAQQYGLNASQEQAAQIASMLGKVMDGQVGALSRYGYKFDAVQEKILKNGTEAQRAAVLFDVVASAVGGVNKALAETPEGFEKQQANDLAGLQERIGGIIVRLKSVFAGLTSFFMTTSDKVISFFEKNEDSIHNFMNTVSNVLVKGFQALAGIVSWVHKVYTGFMDGLRDGRPVFVAIAALVTGVTVTLVAYKTIMGIVSVAVKLWAGAQALLNAVLTANPIGLIIAGVVALIALIAFLIIKIDGWGDMWRHTVEGCKLLFKLFVDTIKLQFNTMLGVLMIGLNKIKQGWYEFKNAVGLGDKSENDRMLADIAADTEARKKAIVNGAKALADTGKKAAGQFKLAGGSLTFNDTSLSDVTGKIRNSLGMGGTQAGTGGGGASGSTANSIATGGSKTTNVTIHLGNLVHTINLTAGGVKEGADKIRDIVLDELSRALTMAQANV